MLRSVSNPRTNNSKHMRLAEGLLHERPSAEGKRQAALRTAVDVEALRTAAEVGDLKALALSPLHQQKERNCKLGALPYEGTQWSPQPNNQQWLWFCSRQKHQALAKVDKRLGGLLDADEHLRLVREGKLADPGAKAALGLYRDSLMRLEKQT